MTAIVVNFIPRGREAEATKPADQAAQVHVFAQSLRKRDAAKRAQGLARLRLGAGLDTRDDTA